MSAGKAVFLDRDGTISVELGYVTPADLGRYALIPGAAKGLRRLKAAGYKLIVTSNQSGVARGYFGLQAVEQVHARLKELLAGEGVELDGIYFCPHLPTASGKVKNAEFGTDCACRKPLPGMVLKAAEDFDLDPHQCWVVGDKRSDLELAHNAGCRGGVLVRTGYGEESLQSLEAAGTYPAHLAQDLAAAADMIVSAG
jgi:D-glycero-D-manno-heptose 1,7-bisphosphate phosphatase